MARIALVAAGTRGDAQDFVALAAGLRERGHRVTLATHEAFRGLAEEHHLPLVPLPGDPRGMLEEAERTRLPRLRANPLGRARVLRKLLDSLLGQITLEDYLRAVRGADLVVFSLLTAYAREAAERLGIPSVLADPLPVARTSAFAHPGFTVAGRLGTLGNLLSYPVAERVLRQPYREPLKPRSRRAVGLSSLPVGRGPGAWPPFPVLQGFSPTLLPPPPDWPAHVQVTGPWLSPSPPGTRLPGAVEEFLAEGPTPLFVGFGSMRAPDAAASAAAVLAGLERAGERAIVGRGWGGLPVEGRGGSILAVDDVAHDLLFPRVKGVVHHGGVGTTHAGLRAGRPTLVVPFVFDQFFWGARVEAVGAGPAPLPHHRLTAERFASRLRELSGPGVAAAAREVGRRMEAEDGVATAALQLERLLLAPG